MLNIFLISMFFIAPATQAADQVFTWQKNPVASYPHQGAQSHIYYNVSEAKAKSLPVKRCILLHGYGVSQSSIDFIVHRKGTGARLFSYHVSGRGVTPVHAFAEGYFGGTGLLNRLGNDVCEEVITVMQESVQSTLLEMTERTEQFLATRACPAGLKLSFAKQKACAVIGHSLGGSIATLVARRCGEKIGMEEGSCRNLAHIYTAASPAGGIGLSAVLLGAKLAEERQIAADFLETLGLLVGLAPDWQDSFKGRVFKLNAIDMFSDAVELHTNPTWQAFGPMLTLDNGQAAILRFSAPLPRDGWFNGRFASTGSTTVEDTVARPADVKPDAEQAKAKAPGCWCA